MKAFEEDGWEIFSTEIEFAKICAATQNWKISHVNSSYEVSLCYSNLWNPDLMISGITISFNEDLTVL